MLNGIITKIEKGCTHDGPGLRTVVYFKGCSLRCAWCSNPETQNAHFEIMYREEKCVHCGRCQAICPTGAIKLIHGRMERTKCLGEQCQKCVGQCLAGALTGAGMRVTVDEVLTKILADQVFYQESDGGVTLTGGETLLQPGFVAELLRLCKSEFIHTAIETAGYAPRESVEQVVSYADLVYMDIKQINSARHCEGTGFPNKLILENARYINNMGKELIIRIPIIPGFNDDVETMEGIGRFVSSELCNNQIELLCYHNYGANKYEQLGRDYTLNNATPPKQQVMDTLSYTLSKFVDRVTIRGI